MINLQIPYSPKKIAQTLLFVIFFLVLNHTLGQACKFFSAHGSFGGYIRLFDLDEENNIPTWYSSSALLFCSFLVGAWAQKIKQSPYAAHWLCLSLLFLFLSIDEAASFHEAFGAILENKFHPTGLFTSAWVIPGLAFIAVVFIAYLKFLWHLPQKTGYQFLGAGTIYILGAVGLEMIAAKFWWSGHQFEGFSYALLVACEEFLEMSGVVVFICSFLSYTEHVEQTQPSSLPSIQPPAISRDYAHTGTQGDPFP
jgi:hypothetical protein